MTNLSQTKPNQTLCILTHSHKTQLKIIYIFKLQNSTKVIKKQDNSKHVVPDK